MTSSTLTFSISPSIVEGTRKGLQRADAVLAEYVGEDHGMLNELEFRPAASHYVRALDAAGRLHSLAISAANRAAVERGTGQLRLVD